MLMRCRRLWMGALSLLLLSAVTANADVAPPDDYKETCTLKKQHFNDTECFECRMDVRGSIADAGDDGYCQSEETYTADGYEKKCKSRGGSVWTEIWCRPKTGAEGPAGEPGSGDGDGCSVITVGNAGVSATLQLLGVVLR